MSVGLRIVIASHGPAQFRFLHKALAESHHVPLAYLMSRSLRPSTVSEPDILEAVEGLVADIPPGVDLLLPGGTGTLVSMLAGYQADVLVVFGFNWRVPREVLELPRLGVLNVHPSALPKYRGPSPVPWAIRNGDPYLGISVHRMTGRMDAGPVLSQVNDIPMPDEVTSEDVWNLTRAALPDLLTRALDRAARGELGAAQDESRATYAGFPPYEWYTVTWTGGRTDLHNQIRVLRFLNQGQGPVTEFQGRNVQVHRTSLTPDGGVRIECADGPLWVTCTPDQSG
jgi:methionyl-tRNA formyltransferase